MRKKFEIQDIQLGRDCQQFVSKVSKPNSVKRKLCGTAWVGLGKSFRRTTAKETSPLPSLLITVAWLIFLNWIVLGVATLSGPKSKLSSFFGQKDYLWLLFDYFELLVYLLLVDELHYFLNADF